ncbi:hypothetical protein J4225_05145 [Candidatus Pacearchaeota archaeon]|nr:hypothetical protein [Candidatus Pacearchaeota archaeon]
MAGIYGESNIAFIKSFAGIIGLLILIACTFGLWFGVLFFPDINIQFDIGYLFDYFVFLFISIFLIWYGFWR